MAQTWRKENFTKRYVCVRTSQLKEYLEQFEVKAKENSNGRQSTYYEAEGKMVLVEQYENGLTIVKTDEEICNKGLVDVNGNQLYSNLSIRQGKVMVANAVIEGTDGVGKTVTITNLVQQGIVCKDRSETICQYMLFCISMDERCAAYRNYLEHETKDLIIFLTNRSKEELQARIKARGGKISEFDQMTYEYNCLYQETYLEMQKYKLSNPIELIDCTGLSIEQQTEKVKSCILRRRK